MIQPGRTVYDEHLFVWPLARISRKLLQTIHGSGRLVASPGLLGPMTARPLKVEADHPIGLTTISPLPEASAGGGDSIKSVACTAYRWLIFDAKVRRRVNIPSMGHQMTKLSRCHAG